MAEPTSTFATAGVLSIAILSLFPGVDPAVVLGSFSGAVVFVMASDELSAAKKVGFFLPSFFGGLLTAKMASSIMALMLPSSVAVSPGVGALITASVVVKTLLWLIARDPSTLLELIKGARR